MAASDALNPQLFHGTTHWFKTGDIIEPRKDTFYKDSPGTYADTDADSAGLWAGAKLTPKGEQPPLFRPVFPVEHVSEHSDPIETLPPHFRRDTQGFRVTGNPVKYVYWPEFVDHVL